MRMRFIGPLTTAAFTLGVVLARPATAQVADDTDRDGIVDTADSCPDSPANEVVGNDGCSLCPCEGPLSGASWASHEEYLSCVGAAVKSRKQARRRDGGLSRKAARAALKAAKKSTCGDVSLTRCCVFPIDDDSDTVIGKCSVVSVEQCDQMSEELDWAEDFEPGSCLPNPCVF